VAALSGGTALATPCRTGDLRSGRIFSKVRREAGKAREASSKVDARRCSAVLRAGLGGPCAVDMELARDVPTPMLDRVQALDRSASSRGMVMTGCAGGCSCAATQAHMRQQPVGAASAHRWGK